MAFPRCEGIQYSRGSRLNPDVRQKENLMTTIYNQELAGWPDKFKAMAIHLVCVAAGGLTTCDFAASTIGGMNQEGEVWTLTKRVNREGETGTFWPRFPLTVVPQLKWEARTTRDKDNFLRRCFADVAKANRDHVKLSVMYVDLNPYGGDYDYKRARTISEEVLKAEPSISEIYFAPELT